MAMTCRELAEHLDVLAEARALDYVAEDYRAQHPKACQCGPCSQYDYIMAHRGEREETVQSLTESLDRRRRSVWQSV